jgi:hypothetical protein
MNSLVMAIRTQESVGRVDADRNGASPNLVIFRLVAVDANETELAHVNVDTFSRVGHARVQVAMLDRVTTPTPEMTASAIISFRPTDALGGRSQIHAFRRQPTLSLLIRSRPIVTNQAIDVRSIGKIEILVHPPVAGVTRRTSRPVALDTDTKVVDEVLLSDPDGLTTSGEEDRLTFPVPMRGVNHLLGCIGVTFQACPRDGRAVSKSLRNQTGVIGVG